MAVIDCTGELGATHQRAKPTAITMVRSPRRPLESALYPVKPGRFEGDADHGDETRTRGHRACMVRQGRRCRAGASRWGIWRTLTRSRRSRPMSRRNQRRARLRCRPQSRAQVRVAVARGAPCCGVAEDDAGHGGEVEAYGVAEAEVVAGPDRAGVDAFIVVPNSVKLLAIDDQRGSTRGHWG